MQISNILNLQFNDPEWHFLAEYSLSQITVDAEPRDVLRSGLLFQTIRDLGVPPDCLYNIEGTLKEFFEEKLKYLNQGKLITPVCVRLFCQKKAVEGVNPTKSASLYNADQTIEPTQIIHHTGVKINGGWGYFLVERGEDMPSGSLVSASTLVDLYLYKEGE